MERKQTSKKYRLTCTAPNELSVYDKKRNKDIRTWCPKLTKFQVDIDCCNVGPENLPCLYLNVKGYK